MVSDIDGGRLQPQVAWYVTHTLEEPCSMQSTRNPLLGPTSVPSETRKPEKSCSPQSNPSQWILI